MGSDDLVARIDDLERRLYALHLELAELRAQAVVSPAEAASTYFAPEPEPEPELGPAPAPRPPAEPYYAPPKGPTLADRLAQIDTAELLGARALAWAGALVTLLGIVFFFVLAVNNGWIGPLARVSLGGVASAIVFGAGMFVHRRYGQLWSALAAVGAGIAGGYATLLAATALYDLVPKAGGLAIATVIAAAGVAVALAWNSQTIAAFGLIGAMAAPGLLALDGGLSATGVAFAAVVLAALIVVAVRRAWQLLLWGGAAVALAQIGALVAATDSPGTAVATLAIVFTALFLGAGIAWQLERHDARTDSLTSTFVLGSAAVIGLSGARILDAGAGQMTEQGLWLVGAALVYGALAAVFLRRGGQRDLATLLTAAALTLGAVAAADFVSGATLAVVWAAEAAALAWLASRLREARFQLAALVYLALAIGHAVTVDVEPQRLFVASRHPAEGVLSLLAALGGALAVAWWARPGALDERDDERVGFLGALDRVWNALAGAQPRIREAAAALAVLLGLGSVSVAVLELAEDAWRAGGTIPAFDRGETILTCVWAALGLAGVLVGLRRRVPRLTDASLLWILAVIAKALAYDTVHLSTEQWAAGFGATAAAALLGGYAFELLETRIARLSAVGPAAAVVALGLGVAAIVGTGEDWSSDRLGAAGLGIAAVYAALGSTILRRRRGMATVLWGLALVLAAPASAFIVQGQWLIAAWAAAGALLVVLAHVLAERRFELASLAYIGLALVGVLLAEATLHDLVVTNAEPGAGLPALAAVVGAMLVFARFGSHRVRPLVRRRAGSLRRVARDPRAVPARRIGQRRHELPARAHRGQRALGDPRPRPPRRRPAPRFARAAAGRPRAPRDQHREALPLRPGHAELGHARPVVPGRRRRPPAGRVLLSTGERRPGRCLSGSSSARSATRSPQGRRGSIPIPRSARSAGSATTPRASGSTGPRFATRGSSS